MGSVARQTQKLSPGEVRNVTVDFTGMLDSGELLTGTPVITGDDDLSFSSPGISTEVLLVNSVSVPIAMAAQFVVDAANAKNGKNYKVSVKCSTDGSQTIIGEVYFKT
jgi:hypothetical protein